MRLILAESSASTSASEAAIRTPQKTFQNQNFLIELN